MGLINFLKPGKTETAETRKLIQAVSPLDAVVTAYIEYLEQFEKHPDLILVTQKSWDLYAKLWPRYRRVITATNFYQGSGRIERGRYVEGIVERIWFYKAEFITVGPALKEPLSSVKDGEIVLTDRYYANPFSRFTIKNHWEI